MTRVIGALVLVAALAGVGRACPWWGCGGPPVVVYPHYCPPPVYYYPPCPPPVVRLLPARPVEAQPVDPKKAPEVVKEDVAPDGWSHVRGRVVYDGGPLPVRKLIPQSGGAYTEDWVVNPTNRGVQNAVVWLVPELSEEQLAALWARRVRDVPGFRPEQVYPGLSLKGERTILHGEPLRAYVPHVLAVQAGSDLHIRDASQAGDLPKWTSRANGEAGPLVPPGRDQRIENLKADRLPAHVESAVYPWMKAYVWVLDHPYFAGTDPDGAFEIKFAPAGNLRLVVWQESMGFRNGREGRWGEAIRVPTGRADLGEIQLKPPAGR